MRSSGQCLPGGAKVNMTSLDTMCSCRPNGCCCVNDRHDLHYYSRLLKTSASDK